MVTDIRPRGSVWRRRYGRAPSAAKAKFRDFGAAAPYGPAWRRRAIETRPAAVLSHMTKAPLPDRLPPPAGRLLAALSDPARRERTAVLLLIAYVAVWTLYGVLAKASQDLHSDMTEMVAWSRELAFGYPKHPPLGAWLTGLWFAVFPTADWSFYLFAMTVAGVALWIARGIRRAALPSGR